MIIEGEPQCRFCKKKTIDYASAMFMVEGVRRHLGCCAACLEKKGRVFYCAGCEDLYKPTKDWGNTIGPYASSPCGTIPCKKHSINPKKPEVACMVCGLPGLYYQYNLRGQMYCEDCWYSCTQCAADYCAIPIHEDQPGVHTVPSGKKTYCTDCAKVKTVPPGAPKSFHPLSWDYDPKCWCLVCQHLSGKTGKWPAIVLKPQPDVQCTICGSPIHSSTTTIINKTKVYCHCCTKKLKQCPVCKERRHNKEFHHSPLAGTNKLHGGCDFCLGKTKMWLCDASCSQWFNATQQCGCGGVLPYNYKPDILHFLTAPTQPHVDPDKVPFLGLELEIEAQMPGASRQKGAKLVKMLAGDYSYIVHDGTLKGKKGDGTGGEYGFEIVTHPFTFEWFESQWPNIEKLLTTLSAKGYRSWEGKRCGQHIHVSRAPMSDAHQMKFIRFVMGHNNMMLCIGQRNYNDPNLSKHSPFHGEDRSKLMMKIRNHSNPGVHGHYTALSTNKEATLEARWFRGTLNPMGVRKNVEFMHSLWYFTKIFGLTSANEINYINWLREPQQSRRYYALLDYLERNYVTRR